jgi:hypothetical protein
MKFRYLLLAGMLGLLAAATAGAQTVIYISGAPAARAPFSTAVYNTLLAAVSGTGGTITYAYSGNSKTTLTTANALAFFGGHITVSGSIVPITVEVSYVGSSAGIQAVADQQPVQFLSGTDTPAGSPYPEPNGATNPALYQSVIPQFTISDEFQKSTPWLGTNTINTNFGTAQTYQTLHSDVVGILPYEFVTNVDAPSSITNITANQARILFEQGLLNLSFLTGQHGDENGYVYAAGRDVGSGLRTVFLSESGIGVQTPITQYAPVSGTGIGTYTSGLYTSGSGAVVSGTYTYITSQALYPNETVNGIPLLNGDGGYSSFTPLQGVLASYSNSNGASITTDGTAGWYVTPLAYSDAKTAQKAGSHEVAWNGVFLTGTQDGSLPASGGASTNLAEGYYTFWSYLQLQYLSSTQSSNKAAANFEAAVGNDLITTDATVLLKNVNVSRPTSGIQGVDGGTILNYPLSPYTISTPYP